MLLSIWLPFVLAGIGYIHLLHLFHPSIYFSLFFRSNYRRRLAPHYIESFLDERWHELPVWFNTLKPRAKLAFVAELLPFIVPKLRQIDVDVLNINEERERLAGLFPDYLDTLSMDEN